MRKFYDTNLNEYGVLILSDRDRIEFDYILEVRGADWVHYALSNLIGNRKPYVSNIAKIAKLEIPQNLVDKQTVLGHEDSIKIIEEIKRKLKI